MIFGFKIIKESELNIDCPIQALGVILGKKWVSQIILILKDDKKKFSELKKTLKTCSSKMLSQQLEMLIIYNIINNTNDNIESFYYLTNKGKELIPIIQEFILWQNINKKHV